MKISHFVPLIFCKSQRSARHKGLHLLIAACHQRTANAVEVNPFFSLVDVISLQLIAEHLTRSQPSLQLQGDFQLLRQCLPPLDCSAQNTQAGSPAQIVFVGH